MRARTDCDVCARGGESKGGGPPDTTTSASDQNDFSIEGVGELGWCDERVGSVVLLDSG